MRSSDPKLNSGYTPGLIGRIVEMHARYYSVHSGFGIAFESGVAGGMAEFCTRLAKPENNIWFAEHDGKVAASIAIDGEDLGNNHAHLRWFIVDDALRGTGIGKALLQRAIAFCNERKFDEIHLWTFKELDAARRLYEQNGFALVEEQPGDQWGKQVLEQKFIRS